MSLPSSHYKLLVTDLDGTAVPMFPGGLPSPRVIDAVAKAKSKLQVSVATGRPFSMASHITEALQITDLSIFHGGTQIRNPKTGERLWSQTLTPELMTQIEALCAPLTFLDEGDAPPLRTEMPQETVFTGNQDMMVIIGIDEAAGQVLLEKLKTIKEINTLLMHSWVRGKFDIHITHIGASKRHALEVLLGMLNIEQHEVIAVGDGGNDLPLFEAAGLKVAMGNASEDLKAKADYITDTVGNDGLAQVIEKFIL